MKHKEFELTSIAWHEVQDKVDVEPLEALLNGSLRLTDYGKVVKKIYFVFIAVRPENTNHQNEVRFNADTATLEVKLNLNYLHVVQGTTKEVQAMMAALFLRSTMKIL